MKDGGPAFPGYDGFHYFNGMSLRDWFAGQALTTMGLSWSASEGHPLRHNAENTAKLAYEMADAMLEARDEKR